jgi:uncharacterized membrane protein YphA (DoxX/SURF4 family)
MVRLAGIVRWVCRWTLAVVFLMAGATKVADLRGFHDDLRLHLALPETLIFGIAVFLPWLELTCGICLALGYAVREAAVLLAGQLVLLVVYSLFHLDEGDCGCFFFPRPAVPWPWWWPVLRNGLLLVGSVILACRAPAPSEGA